MKDDIQDASSEKETTKDDIQDASSEKETAKADIQDANSEKETIKIDIQDAGPGKKVIKVEILVEEVNAEFENAYEEVGKEHRGSGIQKRQGAEKYSPIEIP